MTHTVSRTHDTLAHVLDAQGRRVSRHDVISDAYAEAERLNGEGMSKIEDGGPAFPVVWQDVPHGGMTLRDWFAGRALSGLIAEEALGKTDMQMMNDAIRCYAMADAMLAARKP